MGWYHFQAVFPQHFGSLINPLWQGVSPHQTLILRVGSCHIEFATSPYCGCSEKCKKPTNHWISWDGAKRKRWDIQNISGYSKQNLKPHKQKWAIHYYNPKVAVATLVHFFSESLLNQFLDVLKFSDGWKTWWWTIIEGKKKHLQNKSNPIGRCRVPVSERKVLGSCQRNTLNILGLFWWSVFCFW